jgi:hypothetical protein
VLECLPTRHYDDVWKCPICLRLVENPTNPGNSEFEAICVHVFCMACIMKSKTPNCPICRRSFVTCVADTTSMRVMNNAMVLCFCCPARVRLSFLKEHVMVAHLEFDRHLARRLKECIVGGADATADYISVPR